MYPEKTVHYIEYSSYRTHYATDVLRSRALSLDLPGQNPDALLMFLHGSSSSRRRLGHSKIFILDIIHTYYLTQKPVLTTYHTWCSTTIPTPIWRSSHRANIPPKLRHVSLRTHMAFLQLSEKLPMHTQQTMPILWWVCCAVCVNKNMNSSAFGVCVFLTLQQ